MITEYTQALEDLFGLVAFQGSFTKAQKYFDIIEDALQRLEAIDNSNSNSNEALKCLELLGDFEWHNRPFKECFPDLFNTIKNYILKSQGQPVEEKMPIKDLVSKHIINHNSIVEVYEQEKDDSHYSKRIYRGMAWEMEKHPVGNRKLKYIFSSLALGKDDFDSDRICIEVLNND